jgi:protein deglycase
MNEKQIVAYFFVYDSFAQFEITPAAFLIARGGGKVIVLGQNSRSVVSTEGFHIKPDTILSKIVPAEGSALVLPGGAIANIKKIEGLCRLLLELHQKDHLLAAICAAPGILAKAGLLNDHKFTTSLDIKANSYLPSNNFIDQDIVVDNNIITAKPYANVEFGLAIARKMGMFEDEPEYASILRRVVN